MLHEWDYIGDGGAIVFIDELMNTQVLDMPARFSVKQSPSGQMLSELIWATNKKYLTITVIGDVPTDDANKYNLSWLLRIASAIR